MVRRGEERSGPHRQLCLDYHGPHFIQLHNLRDIWEIVFSVQPWRASWRTFLKSNFSGPGVVDVPALFKFGNYSPSLAGTQQIVGESEPYEMSLSDRF